MVNFMKYLLKTSVFMLLRYVFILVINYLIHLPDDLVHTQNNNLLHQYIVI